MNMGPFEILNELVRRHQDDRGYLDVLYEQNGVVLKRSYSKAGVFRGMHWQSPPHTQTKIVRVVSGKILDFVLDPSEAVPHVYHREISPADGWVRIDEKYAHGFYALQDTDFEYLCLGGYNESAEISFSIVDYLKSELNLSRLILSDKDRAAKALEVTAGTK